MRVLLDTNIFLSYLLAPKGERAITQIVKAGTVGKFTLLVSPQLLLELISKASAKKYLSQRITPSEIKELVALLLKVGEELPEIKEEMPTISRDPKDDYLLAAALLGRADYLVTGDKDLLDLKQVVEDLQILSPRDFIKKIDSSTAN